MALAKGKKSKAINSDSDIPAWLQEDSPRPEDMSNVADPWLSETAVSEVTKALSKGAKGLGATSKVSSSSKQTDNKQLKRPRTVSSGNESPSSKQSADKMKAKDRSSSSGKSKSSPASGSTAPVASSANINSSSSDTGEGEDVIIDDCTFSDDGDCVVVEKTLPTTGGAVPPSPLARPPQQPARPTATTSAGPGADSTEPTPFGLGEVVPVDQNTVLVTTELEFCLLLWGAYQVRVLRGAVQLHGAVLTPARADFLPVFALRVKALPPLRPAAEPPGKSSPPKGVPVLPEAAATALRNTKGCVLLLRRLPSRLITLLSARLGDTFTPRPGGDDAVLSRVGCYLLRDAAELRNVALTTFTTSAEWEEQLRQLAARSAGKERLRVAFAGGKGVGKSSWMYHVLNTLLNTWRHVYVLDVDPGQAEFTPCACLSLVKVDAFLVGPSFTHLMQPVRSVFTGEISVANDPSGYLDGVHQLVTAYKELTETDPAPLLVNTMGWAKGLGEDLLLEVLGMTQPTDLLEVHHPNKKEVNFELPLTPERVNGAGRSWLLAKYLAQNAPRRSAVGYRHSRLASPAMASKQRQPQQSALAPWMYRQLNTTAFVASLERDGRLLCQLTPVCVPWSCLAVSVSAAERVMPQHLMHAINGTVVALCITDQAGWATPEDRTMFSLLPPQLPARPPCIGFGLVRGVDPQRRLLYLLTNVPADQLTAANAVVRGPHHLLDVFPADSGLRSWTPALTEDAPVTPLAQPNRRYKLARRPAPANYA